MSFRGGNSQDITVAVTIPGSGPPRIASLGTVVAVEIPGSDLL